MWRTFAENCIGQGRIVQFVADAVESGGRHCRNLLAEFVMDGNDGSEFLLKCGGERVRGPVDSLAGVAGQTIQLHEQIAASRL